MKAVDSLRMGIVCITMLLGASILSGCAIPGAASQDAPADVKNAAAYTLNPGDVIKLTVYMEENLNGQYTVDRHGAVTIPLIGDVEAQGLSKEQLQAKVASTLVKGGYLKTPLVTVDVISTRPFYILGEVKNPGSYVWQPSIDVFKAIATAGGYTPRAAQNKILIDRGVGDEKKRYNATEDTPVLPGDSITVRERIF
ncbi:MAG TPA: polysaccharide biosynthesis/export family protein [Rickettsiales bacterium]|nr:polysaccharide biosynthesis/export family protein [Rickettsiales bacterium]